MVGNSSPFVKPGYRSLMIRAAEPRDAGQIAEVHVSSWQAAYVGILSSEFLGGLDTGARTLWWEAALARGETEVLVVEDRGSVVGFCWTGASDDGTGGEVLAIYVHPDHWRRGLGRELITGAEDRLAAMGHQRAGLWVLADNTRGRRFYESQGWELGRPFRLETIGGVEVTELPYEKRLEPSGPLPDPRER